jgi:hypothetical protein
MRACLNKFPHGFACYLLLTKLINSFMIGIDRSRHAIKITCTSTFSLSNTHETWIIHQDSITRCNLGEEIYINMITFISLSRHMYSRTRLTVRRQFSPSSLDTFALHFHPHIVIFSAKWDTLIYRLMGIIFSVVEKGRKKH